MDLFSNTSDLDLSVNFRTTTVPFPREKKIQTLRKFARKLYAIQSKGHVYGVLPIPTAKVPILKCVDRGTGVECDISVENRDGILKSQIIHLISSIDERFKKLSFLMKNWAKAHNINSSKDKTLNSLSIILLVAFHLQTRNPPILPPFAAIFKDGTDPATVVKSLSNFVNYGQRNRESLAELFVTLLIKLSSVEKLWAKGLCASACSASWTSKTWNSKVACIGVEDFTDQSQNVARAVGPMEVKQIYKCVDISLRYIFSFVDGQIGDNVKDLLFGQDGIPTSILGGIPNLRSKAAMPGCLPQVNQSRKTITGKRKKQAMHGNSVRKSGVVPEESCPRTLSVGQEQVQQAVQVESSLAKKMRTEGGWRVMPDGSWAPGPVEGQVVAQHVVSIQDNHVPGWGEIRAGNWHRSEQAAGGGWVVTKQSGAGGCPGTELSSSSGWGVPEQLNGGSWGQGQHSRGGGWEGTPQPSDGGWEVTHQSSARGWERTKQHSGGGWEVVAPQSSMREWEQTQQHSGEGWGVAQQHRYDWGEPHLPSGRGWGGTQPPNGRGWGGTQPLSDRGWGGTQPPSGRGWGGTHIPSDSAWGDSQPPSGGAWGGTQPPSHHGWEETQPPSGCGWEGSQLPSGRGWGGTQPPSGRGWGGTHPPSDSAWGDSQPPSGGAWGGTQPPSHGWEETQLPSGGGWGANAMPFEQRRKGGGGQTSNPLRKRNRYTLKI